MTKEDKERIEKEADEYDHGPDDGMESPHYFYGHTAGYIDGATSENERLSAEIERLKKENELLSKLLGPMFGPKVHRDQNEIP
jgi:hypothetical protein